MNAIRVSAIAITIVTILEVRALAAPVDGMVVDANTSEGVPGAVVRAPNGSEATTSANGIFHIDLPPGIHVLTIAAPNAAPQEQELLVPEAGEPTALLVIEGTGDGEVVVVRRRAIDKVKIAPAAQALDREELVAVPGARGDATSAVTNLPGVALVTPSRASVGPLVIRGTAPEDSTYLIDGVEVPFVTHAGDLRAIMPARLIEDLEYIPGGFGVEYGRSTGGVVHLKTREPDMQRWQGFAELSFIDLSAFVQGPVAKNTAVTAAVRRSVVDTIIPAVVPKDEVSFQTPPSYLDWQGRVDWKSGSHSLSGLVLGAFDELEIGLARPNPNDPADDGHQGGRQHFTRSLFSWHYGADDLDSKATLWLGSLGMDFFWSDRDVKIATASIGLREDLRWSLSPSLGIRLGGDVNIHRTDYDVDYLYAPQEGQPWAPSLTADPRLQFDEVVTETRSSLYTAADLGLGRLTLSPGMRVDHYSFIGEGTISPRMQAAYRVSQGLTARASLGAYSRPLQLAEGIVDHLKPERSLQAVGAIEARLGGWAQVTGSLFYSKLSDLATLDIEGMGPSDNALDGYSNNGRGRAYGAELFAKAKTEHFFGWLSYTLARSERRDDAMSDWRLFDYDQAHNLAAVASWQHGNWGVGGRFRLATGEPLTPVTGAIYQSDLNVYRPTYGAVNSERVETAHQLDVRVERRLHWPSFDLTAYVDLSNVYAHARTVGYSYNYNYTEREPITDVPFLPSIGLKGAF